MGAELPSADEDSEAGGKEDSENEADSDFLVWSFSSPEEKVVKEVRPVIGA